MQYDDVMTNPKFVFRLYLSAIYCSINAKFGVTKQCWRFEMIFVNISTANHRISMKLGTQAKVLI